MVLPLDSKLANLHTVSTLPEQFPTIGASLFAIIMAFSTLRVFQGRGWWPLLMATVLESAGFIALAIHSQDNTQHVAFLASFSATAVAPVLILIANMQTFGRLVKCITMPSGSYDQGQLSFRTSVLSTAFAFLACLCLPLLSWAIYDMGVFLSPQAIKGAEGAMARLGHFDRSLGLLVAAHAFQALLCLGFGMITLTFLFRVSSGCVAWFHVREENSRKLLGSINVVNGLVLLRSLYKVFEYTSVILQKMEFADTGYLFWFFDTMPILCALMVFCAVDPANSLSESFHQNFCRSPVHLDLEASPCDKAGLLD